MPRKEKPPARRAKRVIESATYTTAELCARYHCSRRTLRRMSGNLGFPDGDKRGREVIYAKVAVHDWERKHMPSLHAEPEKTDEDKQWDRMRARYLLDKEERDQPPPKLKRQGRAATL